MKARSFIYRRPDDLNGALGLLADNAGEPRFWPADRVSWRR